MDYNQVQGRSWKQAWIHASIFPLSNMRHCAARNARHRAASDYTTYPLGSRTGISSLLPKLLENCMCAPQLCSLLLPDPGGQGKGSFLLTVLPATSVFSCQLQSKLGGLEALGGLFTQHAPWPKDWGGSPAMQMLVLWVSHAKQGTASGYVGKQPYHQITVQKVVTITICWDFILFTQKTSQRMMLQQLDSFRRLLGLQTVCTKDSLTYGRDWVSFSCC